MYMIDALVRPNKVDAVKTALARLGVLGLTAVEAKGYGRQLGHSERYRDQGFVPKVLLKICVKSPEKDAVIKAIVQSAHTGEVGDGKIFIYPIEDVVRIRTNETGESAL